MFTSHKNMLKVEDTNGVSFYSKFYYSVDKDGYVIRNSDKKVIGYVSNH